ncbi:ATP-binding protein [Oceanobacillus halotolerans]|uniref:ATP-binding protein n=1 Tax=Oceanobacillus halotolerans TaxID=2663380 RepID=UPI0013DACFD8|nr:ATP-binding protein [Oceanobacillus halotolerans]
MEYDNERYRNIVSTKKEEVTSPKVNSDLHHLMDLSSLPSFILQWIEHNSNDIITICDEKGNLIYVSKTVEDVLGYQPSELMGTSYYDKISEDDLSNIRKYFDKDSDELQLFMFHMRTKDSKLVWLQSSTGRVSDPESNRTFLVSILKDITEKKEAEELMIRSEKMSVAGQLAAGIAHEIRNPLTSLKGFLQLLQAGVNHKKEYYKIMVDEIEKMETITSELLYISKPLTEYKQEESLQQMLDDVVALLKPQAKLRNIIIRYDVASNITIYCDRSQIKQVFINLIKNAIEAMENGGEIKVTATKEDKTIAVDVVDEGPGVPEEIIHKLGEPFFTTKQDGTGLGLMITQQILERHDGKLEIMRNEKKGSTFRIELPIQH